MEQCILQMQNPNIQRNGLYTIGSKGPTWNCQIKKKIIPTERGIDFTLSKEKILTWMGCRRVRHNVWMAYHEIPIPASILVAISTSSPLGPPIPTSILQHSIIPHSWNSHSLLIDVCKQCIQRLRLLLRHYINILLQLLRVRRWLLHTKQKQN